MAHDIEDIRWRSVGGYARLYFTLDGRPAFMHIMQKRVFLDAGFVSILPDAWDEVLRDIVIERGDYPGIDGDVIVNRALKSERLALALIELQDAVEAGTWRDDARFEGEFSVESEHKLYSMRL